MYVVSARWMKQWKQYVGIQSKGLAQFCVKVPTTKGKSRPGPISNDDILEDPAKLYASNDPEDMYNVALRPDMREKADYKLLNRRQWEYLHGIYQGNPIRRERCGVAADPVSRIEVHFANINLIVLPNRSEFAIDKILPEKHMCCGHRWTLSQVKERIARILSVPPYARKVGLLRLWKLSPLSTYDEVLRSLMARRTRIRNAVIENKDEKVDENAGIEFPGLCLDQLGNLTMDACHVRPTDKVIVELANEKGEFIFKYFKNVKIGRCDNCLQEKPLTQGCKCGKTYCSEACQKSCERFHASSSGVRVHTATVDVGVDKVVPIELAKSDSSSMGLTGLQNLGNTCFMNSGIQCLSHTWELTKYFLDGLYAKEINTKNSLGLKGDMATAHSSLMKMLWYGSASSVSPWEFKKTIGRFRSAFSSFSQQDSQELVSSVLDALHEDLNRVTVKPYTELKSTDDPNDDSISVDSWCRHLQRNQSIVVDLMHGQFKSVVNCPKCNRYSVTFDPFSVVPLPIPMDADIAVPFLYVRYDLAQPIVKAAVLVKVSDTIKTFREKVAELLSVSKDSYIITCVSSFVFVRFFCRDRKVKHLEKLRNSSRRCLVYLQEIKPAYFAFAENVDSRETAARAKSEGKRQPPPAEEDKSRVANHYNSHSFSGNTKGNNNKQKRGAKKPGVQDHDDFNNGMPGEYLKVCLTLFHNVKDKYRNKTNKEPITFERVLYVRRSDSLLALHYEVFRYLRPIFDASLGGKDLTAAKSDEERFAQLFPGLSAETQEKKLVTHSEYPYILRFVNPEAGGNAFQPPEKCPYCGSTKCRNCPVPFLDSRSVHDALKKLSLANDYFYQKHRSIVGSRFELEAIFNDDQSRWGMDPTKLDYAVPHAKFTETVATRSTGVGISACFDLFSRWESLDDQNLWYCNRCKEHVRARKKLEIFRSPPILILQLKRFKAKEGDDGAKTSARAARINSVVDFPLEGLDLAPYVRSRVPPPMYDLYAVSNHYGGVAGGHYTAFARDPRNGGWYEFDDSAVSKADKARVCSAAAYLLFYRRRDLAEKGGEVDYGRIRQELPEGFCPIEGDGKDKAKDKAEAKMGEKKA